MMVRQRGLITAIHKGGKITAVLQDCNDWEVNCYPCGKMRIKRITLSIGDEVDLELSPYDLHKGRIVWRY